MKQKSNPYAVVIERESSFKILGFYSFLFVYDQVKMPFSK